MEGEEEGGEMGTHTIRTRSPRWSFPRFITKSTSNPFRKPAAEFRSLHIRRDRRVVHGVGVIGWSVPCVCDGDLRRFGIPGHVFDG